MKKLILLLVFVPVLFLSGCFWEEETVWSRPVGGKKFTEALIYCSNLKENGVSDWRLPTTGELSALNENSGYYWASDPMEKLNKNKHANEEEEAWYYDFSAKKKDKSLVFSPLRVVCVRNVDAKQAAEMRHNAEKDEKACKFAQEESKKSDDTEPWIKYIKEFSDGMCTEKAEDAVFQHLKKLNTRAAWEEYLRIFPKGIYEFEARSRYDEMKNERIGNLEWSDRSPNRMKWSAAENYCRNLKENGSGWKLPDIDELRMLVKDRETASGGACKVSKKNKCLDGKESGCWTLETCAQDCQANFDCKNYKDGRFSRLGDAVWLWSSCKGSQEKSTLPWGIDFRNGHIGFYPEKKEGIYVRCVR